MLTRLYHKQIGAGKALGRFGYGIISHVNPHVGNLHTVPCAARPVVEAVVSAHQRYGLFPASAGNAEAGAPVVVGVSGGADSVCLLHVLWLLAPQWRLVLHAAHLDHGLRPSSQADADFVASLAATMGLAFHLKRVAGEELIADALGVEAAARARRYAFLMQVAASIASPSYPSTVTLAHHMDDQAETVLMNVLRGSGLRGLGGMPWTRIVKEEGQSGASADAVAHSVKLVRPLLGVRRSQVLDYLDAYGLAHHEDPTNLDTARLRNRVRRYLLPSLTDINPQVVEALARTAHLLGSESERADMLDRQALARVAVEASPAQRYVVDLEQYLQLPLAARRGVLRLSCEHMALDLREVGYEILDDIVWRVHASQAAGGPHTLVQHVMWTVIAATPNLPALLSIHHRDVLPIQPQHPHLSDILGHVTLPCRLACPGALLVTPGWRLSCKTCGVDELPTGWREQGKGWRAFLDADEVQAPSLGTPAPRMSIAPLGMAGHRKQLGDYFTDRKTPTALRANWPILVDAATDEVVWVCGHDIAHRVRITDTTRRVLCLEWLPAQPSPCGANETHALTLAPGTEEALCVQT